MQILISSRNVPAYKLKIFSGSKEVFSGLLHSRIENIIDVGRYIGSSLRFQWSFDLSKEEKNALIEDKTCPAWRMDSYNSTISEVFADTFAFEMTSSLAETATFSLVIDDIPSDMEKLHLFFRKTKLIDEYALLDVRYPKEEEQVDIYYINNHVATGKAIKSNLKMITKYSIYAVLVLLVGIMGFLIPFMLYYYIGIFASIVFLVVGIIIVAVYHHMKFSFVIKKIARFKETKDDIIKF